MNALRLCYRALLRLLRLPRALSVFVLAPLLALWLLCQIFGRLPQVLHAFPVPSYLAFIAPALAVAGALPSAIGAGARALEDRDSGFLEQVLATPVTPAMLLLAELAASALSALATVPVVVLAARGAGLTVGGSMDGYPLGALALLPLALALNGLYAGIALAASALLPSRSAVMRLMGAILGGSAILCDLLLPASLLPGWLISLARLNPLSYAIDGAREVLGRSPSWLSYSQDLLVLVGLMLASACIAVALQTRLAEARLTPQPA